MALQNVKHVAWLAYQLELKETQKHRDNGVNHCLPFPVQFPGAPSSVERTDSGCKTRVKNRKRNPGPQLPARPDGSAGTPANSGWPTHATSRVPSNWPKHLNTKIAAPGGDSGFSLYSEALLVSTTRRAL
ncbi:hypothetical protein BJV77DRAFT_961092 [Russula vinacea]|nr:hypothetical protein BJV77DRAFT_961092 [Russula vinacea]